LGKKLEKKKKKKNSYKAKKEKEINKIKKALNLKCSYEHLKIILQLKMLTEKVDKLSLALFKVNSKSKRLVNVYGDIFDEQTKKH